MRSAVSAREKHFRVRLPLQTFLASRALQGINPYIDKMMYLLPYINQPVFDCTRMLYAIYVFAAFDAFFCRCRCIYDSHSSCLTRLHQSADTFWLTSF